MKRLFFIIAATLMMTANLMAEDVMSNTRLVCIDNTFYYGKQVINKDQILNWYAQQNCQAAYNQYKKGQKMATAGWICLGILPILIMIFAIWMTRRTTLKILQNQ